MLVELPFIYFPKIKLNKPIFDGFVYFGEPDTDPYTNTSKRIAVTYIGSDGVSNDLVQPLRTSKGGVPIVDGDYVKILIDQDYSMTACGKNNEQIFHIPNSKNFESDETIIEDVFLSDGQTKVFFNKVKTGNLSYYISGNFVDRGKLHENIDYTIAGDNNILLVNSFPAGSVLSAMQNPIEGESDNANTNSNRTKQISDGYTLTDLDSQSILVFDSSTDATINIPDGLTVGCGVIVSNIAQGGVIASFSTDTWRGNDQLIDRSGQLSIIKFKSTVWQSSERGSGSQSPLPPSSGAPVVDPGLPAIPPPSAISDAVVYDWDNSVRVDEVGDFSSSDYGTMMAVSGDGNSIIVGSGKQALPAYKQVSSGNFRPYTWNGIEWVFDTDNYIGDPSVQLEFRYDAGKLNFDGTVCVTNSNSYIYQEPNATPILYAKPKIAVFVKDAGQWPQLPQFLYSPEDHDNTVSTREASFVIGISGSGDWVATSNTETSFQQSISDYNGALYLYKRTSGVYDYKQKIQFINVVELGSSIVISGDDSTMFAVGGDRIYVFSNDSGVWNYRYDFESLGLDNPTSLTANFDGSILAFSDGGNSYIYYGSGDSWALENTVPLSGHVSVNSTGNSALTCTSPTPPPGFGINRVSVWNRNSGVWTEEYFIDYVYGVGLGGYTAWGIWAEMNGTGNSLSVSARLFGEQVNLTDGTHHRGSSSFINAEVL